jgi:hypothetical protein
MKALQATLGLPSSARGRAGLIGLGFALAFAVWWFQYVSSLPGAFRVRGDAAGYFLIALRFRSWSDALSYVEYRSVGFPFILYAARRLFEALGGAVSLADSRPFLSAFAAGLFGFHVASTLVFIRAAHRLARRAGLELPWLPLALLLAHPGLVAQTTVLHTETLCADLLMLCFALLAAAALRASLSSRLAFAAGSGVLLGAVALVRTSYGIPIAVALAAGLAISSAASAGLLGRRPGARRFLPLLAIAAACFALALAPAVARCRSAFGRACLQDPDVSDSAVYRSLSAGRSSPRHYWTRYSTASDGLVIVRDPSLVESWESQCVIEPGSPDKGLLACFLGHPLDGARFLVKKSIALLDHYYIHPYAVDMTPRWVRWVSRPFGALAFAGLGCCSAIVVAVAASRRRASPARAVLGSTLAFFAGLCVLYCAVHCLFHIEPRYGLGAMPGLYLGLSFALARLRLEGPSVRRAAHVALFWLGVLFLAQTARWDRLDPYLAKIEQQ